MFSYSNKMVEDWLHSLGQLEYIESFIDNGYDEIEICKQIGEKDLDAIGVLNHVHRKNILHGVSLLTNGVDPQKRMYFILENPHSPSKKAVFNNFTKPHSNSSSVASSLSSKSNGISSSTSGISVHISSSSHENSVDSDGEIIVLQNNSNNMHHKNSDGLPYRTLLNSDKENSVNSLDLTCKSSDKGALKGHSIKDEKLDSSGSFEIEELDSNVPSVCSSLKNHKKSSTASMEDLGQRLAKLKIENASMMRPSCSYTSGYAGHPTAKSNWRNSLSEAGSCTMISAYGHANRSVPPPLPRCPPPSGSCTDISDMDSLISQPTYDNRCSRMMYSNNNWNHGDCTLPRTSTLNSQIYLQPGEINSAYAASIARSDGLSTLSDSSKVNSLKRMFSFRKNSSSRKYYYKPTVGDLSAGEITMSDEDRIRLMVMVKEGTLSMHEALATVKQYESERKKGVNKNLNDYIAGDSIKIPVSPDKSSKSSPFRFLRSFSFRSSKRRKLLQDLQYYYKEQEKRQKSIRDRMATVEVGGDESTYSSPQCCTNQSCDQSGRGTCTGRACTQKNRQCTSPSPGASCDTHLYCYGTCSKPQRSDLHLDSFGACPVACANSPVCSVRRESSFRQSKGEAFVPPAFKRSCSECGSNPPNRSYHDGQENHQSSYFDRTYRGRHSFHGVPPRRHSDVITFVHHVQSSPVPQAYTNDVYGGCQGHSVCEPNMGVPAYPVYPNYPPPSTHRCHQHAVVSNPIAEEHSPCISSSSSTEDVNLGPSAVFVKASVHRSDEDNVNNNSPTLMHSVHQKVKTPLLGNNFSTSADTSRPNSALSNSPSLSHHSLSTESELPIEQYKPKKPHQAFTKPIVLQSSQNDNANKIINKSPANQNNDHQQENYAQTTVAVKSNGAPQTVEQLCRKLAIGHLLSIFLNNGFETLELFKQLDEDDLTTLGVTDLTDRAKVMTAVTLLPEEEGGYDLPAYAYKSMKETGLYSKVGEPINNRNENNNSLATVPLPDNNNRQPAPIILPLAVMGRNSPVFNGVLPSTRDSGCYMDQLNSSAQSQC